MDNAHRIARMKKIQWLTSSEVRKQLNISTRQLYYWELKGIVQPRSVTRGSRKFKRFSTDDLEKLQKVKEYLDQGYTLETAARRVSGTEQAVQG